YSRIAAVPRHLPPLRERREDLPLLTEALLARLANGRKLRLSPAAMAILETYDFPGNIRELRNILERAVLLTDGEVIRSEVLQSDLTLRPHEHASVAEDEILPLDEAGRRYVRWALGRVNGDKKRLARLLGISERTLYRKLET
ncbi:MAG: helix-turn-helix domain-containing protein, partial [Thiobacillaceae bacterium]